MNRTLKAAAAAALALCTSLASAQKTRLPEIKYEKFTLPNGLTVITHEDHRLPLVAVDLWYHVGPLNERAGRTGFAHLFEHMMFEGSEHVGEKQHIKIVDAAGATGVNGTTSFDRTNYFETLPSNQLELGLWLESDRMGFLMEGLDRKLLQNQRDVVRNERRQGEGRPYNAAEEEVYHLLFPASHPYYADVIGSHADVEAARIADIRDFHQQFYTPNNASIAIAGDFNPRELRELLTKYFGPIPMGPKVEPVNTPTPPITAQKRETVTDTVRLPRLDIAWLTPAIFTPDSYAVQSAMSALGGGRASRLSQALVLKTQVAQSVRCNVQALKLTGIAQCSITAKPGVKLEDLEATTWAEIARLQKDGPTADEVAAAKAGNLTRKIVGLQHLGGFGGIADSLDEYNQYTGDPGYLSKDVAATDAVTIAGAQAAAQKYLTKDSAVVVYCVPGKKVLNDVPRSPDNTDADVKITNPYTAEFEAQQNFRKTKPVAGPPVVARLPVPQTFTLPNGLKVYVVEDKALPVLSAQLVIRAGGENNPAGKDGLSVLTGQIMSEATVSKNVTQLAEAQERIGTRVGLASNVNAVNLDMTVLTSYTAPAMDLFSDILEHPAFSPDDLERLRRQRLTGIQQEGDNVQTMAQRVGPRLVYGDTPYGQSGLGTTASIKSLTLDDVKGFYAGHFGPADSALVLVGDLTLGDARKLAEHSFGSWSGTASAVPTLPAPPTLAATHVVIVDKPGAPQTALFAYGLGVPANSPDLATLQVMNYILGGSFASRINMNLREVHGYTYGANSQFPSNRAGGDFVAGGLVRTDVTGPAAKEMLSEIKRFPKDLPTENELSEAKTARIQSLPGQFETTSVTAASMASLFLFDRPLNFWATLPDRYRAVTPADIARVATQDLHPNQLILVTAGDRSKIEPGLKAADLGPIEVRDINGLLVTTPAVAENTGAVPVSK